MSARREIGGYLELERFSGSMLHEGDVALNCGRACLEYLAELRGIRAVRLPDFLCSSVPNLCRRVGVEVRTYQVSEGFKPACDFEMAEGEWLYLVDYYGQLSKADVDAAVAISGGRLIVDESQGYYRDPWEGADTLYTCRKWFGVADGAFLHTHDGRRLDRELPRAESFDKMGFVLGRFERPAGEFFAESKDNHARFADEPMAGMSALTENLLHAVDYGAAKERRLANWTALDSMLGSSNRLSLAVPEAPFMYPYMAPDAEDVRGRMAAEGVFVPTLWPNVPGDVAAGPIAIDLANDILPLPVDQRYGADDMERVLEVLSRCLS